MADPNVGELAATVWEQRVGDKPNDNIFNSFALFNALGEMGMTARADGGRLFEVPIEYKENENFRAYGEFDELDTQHINVFDAARFDQRVHAGTVTYSNLEQLRSSGSGRKTDLIADRLENGMMSHMASMNRSLWAASAAANDFDTIQQIIDDTPTTGTVGGINAATFSFWRNRQASGAQSSTAFDNLRSTLTSVYNQCSLGGVMKTPTWLIGDRESFEGYEGTLTQIERITREQSATGGDIGFVNSSIMFKGARFMYDEDAPDDEVRMGNSMDLKFAYLMGGWMRMYPEVDPYNQLANVHKVATFGNLTTGNRRHLGVVNSIS